MNRYCGKCLKITKNNKFEKKLYIDEKLVFTLTTFTMVLKDLQQLMRKK